MLRPHSTPGLRDELRGKKRVQAARWMGKSPGVHVVWELTTDSWEKELAAGR